MKQQIGVSPVIISQEIIVSLKIIISYYSYCNFLTVYSNKFKFLLVTHCSVIDCLDKDDYHKILYSSLILSQEMNNIHKINVIPLFRIVRNA